MDIMIRRFFRHLWQSIKNLKRNGWMTVAAVSSVTITLILVGIFAAFLLNTEKLASGIEKMFRLILICKLILRIMLNLM